MTQPSTETRSPLRRYLRRREAASYLGLSEATLRNWSVLGRGPRVTRIGRTCVYDIAELDAFAEGRSEQPDTPAEAA